MVSKKTNKKRGSKTYGYGAMKKHRGYGSKGGRGKAGSGKKAGQFITRINKKEYFGKKGFNPHSVKYKAINLSQINKLFEYILEDSKKKNLFKDAFLIKINNDNSKQLIFDFKKYKVLGMGNLNQSLIETLAKDYELIFNFYQISENAKSKIKNIKNLKVVINFNHDSS